MTHEGVIFIGEHQRLAHSLCFKLQDTDNMANTPQAPASVRNLYSELPVCRVCDLWLIPA